MNTPRITLRPAQAAAFLNCSPASLWRWAKSLEGFPQGHALKGQRFTFWYQDELEAWLQSRAEKNRQVEDLACRLSEPGSAALRTNGERGQPFIAAYLLAGGGSLHMLANESGIGKDRVRRLAGDDESATSIETASLFKVAVAQILYREKELARELTKKPTIQNNAAFLGRVDDLSQANKLCFGESLLEYAEKLSGGSRHGND